MQIATPSKAKVLFRYLGEEGTLKTLGNGSLLWSNPASFNDPFDCHPDLLVPPPVHDIVHKLRQLLFDLTTSASKPRFKKPGRMAEVVCEWRAEIDAGRMAQENLRQHIDAMLEDWIARDAEARLEGVPQYEQVTRQLVARMRVLCTSRLADCPLLWAHYANKHKGAALVLPTRLPTPCGQNTIVAQRIMYQDDIPIAYTADWFARYIADLEVNDERAAFAAKQAATTKSRIWGYEHEFRFRMLAGPNEEPTYTPLKNGYLRAVLLGCRADASFESSVRQLVESRYPGVPVCRVQMLKRKFGLVVPEWSN